MRAKVREWWGLEIVTVQATRRKQPWTIVQDCEKKNLLPALAYGSRSCSQRFKQQPMERYIKGWMRENGVTEITKCIGYHADEGYRAKGKPTSKQLAKGLTEYYWYPLVEWQWRQEDCQSAICRHGIPQAGKSACYFCPASKRSEVVKLKETHPHLLESALKIEASAQARNRTKSKVRAKVEHAFLVIKRIFGWAKVRYRGLAKNTHWLQISCGLANLYVARR